MKLVIFFNVLFLVIVSFLEESFIFPLFICVALGVLFKTVQVIYMASKHVCNKTDCTESNHLTWKILNSVGILNPEVNPLKSINFVIHFDPTKDENTSSYTCNHDYMNLSLGVWQVCVADISISYNTKRIPENCQGGILAVRSNIVLGLNSENFSEEVILDKFYFQKLKESPNAIDIEYLKNDNKTWFTINSCQKNIKLTIVSFVGFPSSFCSAEIVVNLLFRKLK